MEADEFLYRALGVPGMVTAGGRTEVAAARLLEAALTGVEPEPVQWSARKPDMRATAVAVVETLVRQLSSGEFDGYLGNLNGGYLKGAVMQVVSNVVLPDGLSRQSLVFQGEALARVGLEKLQALADQRPDLGWSQP